MDKDCRKNSIISILKEFEPSTLIEIWNKYSLKKSIEDYIHVNSNDELIMVFGNDISEALRAAYYGNYSPCDEYFLINKHGNLTSFNEDNVDEYINFENLADYIMENGCSEITEVWYEDIEADFRYYLATFYDCFLSKDYDFSEFNLVTEDWDYVYKQIK